MKKYFSNIYNKIGKTSKLIFKIIIFILGAIFLLYAGVFIAMKLHLTNVSGKVDPASNFFNTTKNNTERKTEAAKTKGPWVDSAEWKVINAGFDKDKDLILKASEVSGVSSRLIVSTIISEQFRFFTSNREAFKRFFEPMKLLGNATQFSYGIAGIKTDTAMTIENGLKDSTSPYYLGPEYEHLLDFTTTDVDAERMTRLTDPHNHYYSYLYTALFLKEITAEWQKAGYPIDNRPEILATLFNIGFSHSKPNGDPQTGGATITVNGKNYTYGSMAFSFYYSDEMTQEFF